MKSILAFLTITLVCAAASAETPMAVGKSPAMKNAMEQTVTSEETPNQRRHRLGQPIVQSFPPVDYGVKEETPNQRRKRLGQPLPPAIQSVDYGVQEETPNQRRTRLAAPAH